MIRDNKFFVKKYDEDENKITLEEERKYHSPFVLFLIKNGRLLLAISLLLSVSVFIIAITLIFGNMKESSIVMYEQNGVVVSFDGDDNSIVNGTPITKEYAEKVFDSNLIQDNNLRGVVIKLKEVSIKDKNKGKVKGVITFYSDRTAIVKYDDGSYKRIYSVNGNYGITESGVIDSKAITNDLSGEYKKNDKYNINLIYLSDGSVIVIKDKVELFVRNSDITSNDDEFFTTLSGVSTPISKKGNKYTYSDGTIKEKDYIIVDDIKYAKVDEKKTKDNIKIIYFDNGYAEIIYNNLNVMVKNSEHIRYNDNIFEIIEKEFGRTLSPIEYEIIKAWLDNDMSEELIKEAIKEATFNGVSNLRYIDKILYEWGKAGIKTAQDVENNRKKRAKVREESTSDVSIDDIVDWDWFDDE